MTTTESSRAARGWSPTTAIELLQHPPQLTRPRADLGLFGPNSPSWQVWAEPVSVIGALRAAIVQMYHPTTAAPVAGSGLYESDPFGRLRRTGQYFFTIVYGDSASVADAARRLHRVHSRVGGLDPVTGRQYCANDADGQMWVHYTTWHSVLYAYERYGPGKLSSERETRFWHEAAIAAEPQGLDPAVMPNSRTEVRDYLASMRPALALTQPAREVLDYIYTPRVPQTYLRPPLTLATRASWALVPAHLRELGGYGPTPAASAALTPAVRLANHPLGIDLFVRTTFPEAYSLREAALHGPTPLHNHTRTYAHAQAELSRKARTA
jgi:uncharacterized protein (DUF2236 family)